MSGFDPVSAAIMVATQGLKMAASNAQAKNQASYQQAVYAQQQAQAQASAQAQLAQLQAARDAEVDKRRRQLKADLASQRAAFGASGLETASSGSAGAVLRGLTARTASDQAEDDKMYGLKASAIGQNLAFANQRSLLEQSRQFAGSPNGLGLMSQGVGLAGGILKSLL